MYLYNRLVLNLRETAAIKGFDFKKEVRKLINNYVLAFFALGAGFAFAAKHQVLTSFNFWIQVSIVFCLSIVYLIGWLVIASNKKSVYSVIFAFGFVLLESLFLFFLYTVFPIEDLRDIYIIMISLNYLAINTFSVIRIIIVKRQIKLGLLIPIAGNKNIE